MGNRELKRACMLLRAIGVATLLSSWKDDASDSRFFRSREVNAASLMASAFFSGQFGKCLSTALSSTSDGNLTLATVKVGFPRPLALPRCTRMATCLEILANVRVGISPFWCELWAVVA
ncbi:hypothetical protein EJB05_07007, partial [Eragrostis curvula]